MDAEASFADVCTEVLRQHQELRARLRPMERVARSARLTPETVSYLRAALDRLVVTFEDHLTFEERNLAPRIRTVDVRGWVRESDLHTEHAEQRAMLSGIAAVAADPGTPSHELAGEVTWLVSVLLDDMAREDASLRFLDEIETMGVCDPMTG